MHATDSLCQLSYIFSPALQLIFMKVKQQLIYLFVCLFVRSFVHSGRVGLSVALAILELTM